MILAIFYLKSRKSCWEEILRNRFFWFIMGLLERDDTKRNER